MSKKKFFGLFLFLGLIIPFLSSAQSETEWKDIRSCLDLGGQLKTLIQDPSFKNQDSPRFKSGNLNPIGINEGVFKGTSKTFFQDYDQEQDLLTIIRGPKDTHSMLLDLKNTKKLVQFRLPKDFSNIKVLFFKENILIISAEHKNSDNHNESLLLFYEIKDNMITPLYFFAQTGKLVKVDLINEKLYLISQEPLSKKLIKQIIKSDGNLNSAFPQYHEGIKYGLEGQKNKFTKCQDFKYLFSPKGYLPDFWTISKIDLNSISTPKETLNFIGDFSQFNYSNDFLYTITDRDENQSLVGKIGLEPKLNYQKSQIIQGNSIINSILTENNKATFITKRNSGKFKSYILNSFDEQFKNPKSIEVFSGDIDYSHSQYINHYILLNNNDTYTFVAKDNANGFSLLQNPLSLQSKSGVFLLRREPLALLSLEAENGKIKLALAEKKQKTFSQTTIYEDDSTLLGNPSWDKENKVLLLPIQGDNTIGIEGLSIGEDGKVQPLFFRRYTSLGERFREIVQFPNFAYVINKKLIDIFIPQSPKKMKVFKRY